MSLSLRDELRVVLLHDQVHLVRIGRKLSLRGLSHRVVEKKTLACAEAPAGAAAWTSPLESLARGLPGMAQNIAGMTVILSNHFVHYAMVPWSEALSNEQEELAYARYCFSQTFGAAADGWELRLTQDAPGAPQLASAVDVRLLEALRTMAAQASVKLTSVQPYLMAAYNNCRDNLRKRDAWFVLYEPGNLCVALLQQGLCRSVRTLKVGSDWSDSLPQILEREAYLSDLDATTHEVLLWAPEQGEVAVPVQGQWKINGLRPAIRPGFRPDYEGRYALAMSA